MNKTVENNYSISQQINSKTDSKVKHNFKSQIDDGGRKYFQYWNQRTG